METAHAPLEGASPSHFKSASELEELPTAMDCTMLALVDDAEGESALLLGEKQDCSVESRDCHEGTCSAAPVAQNEFSDKEAMPAAGVAIANQTPRLIEQGNPTSLLVENSVPGVEIKAVHEGTCSTVPVPSAEKWSHEAIVARSNVRPERMQKLKVGLISCRSAGMMIRLCRL
jgi:hypothetical protein